ncbi:hypothetical protein FRC06_010276 [Ceratobasidium sp. 370]|nr:hypothetical protein FRC06_010276 [Ceratobasidium sp. 370]
MAISQCSSSVISKHKTSTGSCTSKSACMPTHTYDDRSNELDSDASLYKDKDLGEIRDTEGKESNRKAKPKMSDYPPNVGEILNATVQAVGAHLLAHRWFLEVRQYDCVILNMWRNKVAKLILKLHRYPLTIQKLCLIKYQVTSYQGWLQEVIKVASLIQYYKLDMGTGKEIAVRVGMLTSNNQFHTKMAPTVKEIANESGESEESSMDNIEEMTAHDDLDEEASRECHKSRHACKILGNGAAGGSGDAHAHGAKEQGGRTRSTERVAP